MGARWALMAPLLLVQGPCVSCYAKNALPQYRVYTEEEWMGQHCAFSSVSKSVKLNSYKTLTIKHRAWKKVSGSWHRALPAPHGPCFSVWLFLPSAGMLSGFYTKAGQETQNSRGIHVVELHSSPYPSAPSASSCSQNPIVYTLGSQRSQVSLLLRNRRLKNRGLERKRNNMSVVFIC